MKYAVTCRFYLLGCALALLSLVCNAGCSGDASGDRYRVSGTLKKGDQPLKFGGFIGSQSVELKFVPMKGNTRPSPEDIDEGDNTGAPKPGAKQKGIDDYVASEAAQVNENGSFEFLNGLPKGKYVVVVRHFPKGLMPPDQPNATWDEKDALKGAFNVTNSPIVVEVDGNKSFEFDLDKYKKNK
jgi:hypothetical protein